MRGSRCTLTLLALIRRESAGAVCWAAYSDLIRSAFRKHSIKVPLSGDLFLFSSKRCRGCKVYGTLHFSQTSRAWAFSLFREDGKSEQLTASELLDDARRQRAATDERFSGALKLIHSRRGVEIQSWSGDRRFRDPPDRLASAGG